MKNNCYFSHDGYAGQDHKIKAMRKKYGSSGYGNFWLTIEALRVSNDFMLPMKNYIFNSLASEFEMEVEDVKKYIDDLVNEFELLKSDGEFFWSDSLNNRMDIMKEKSDKAAEAGRRSGEARRRGSDRNEQNEARNEEFEPKNPPYDDKPTNERPTNVERTLNERLTNANEQQTIKIESKIESKIKESISPFSAYSFDSFWNDYDKKYKKEKCQEKWDRLKPEEKEQIRLGVKGYVARIVEEGKAKKTHPANQFQPHPMTFLNGKMWKDETFLQFVRQQNAVQVPVSENAHPVFKMYTDRIKKMEKEPHLYLMDEAEFSLIMELPCIKNLETDAQKYNRIVNAQLHFDYDKSKPAPAQILDYLKQKYSQLKVA
jgi:Domain of unknown function (DUF4373)